MPWFRRKSRKGSSNLTPPLIKTKKGIKESISSSTIDNAKRIQSLLDNKQEYYTKLKVCEEKFKVCEEKFKVCEEKLKVCEEKLKVCEENNKQYEKYIDSIEKYREKLTKYKDSKKIIPRQENNTNNSYRKKVNNQAEKYKYSIPEPNLPPPMLPPMLPPRNYNINNVMLSSSSRNENNFADNGS